VKAGKLAMKLNTKLLSSPFAKVASILVFILFSGMWAREIKVFSGAQSDRPSIWLGIGGLALLVTVFGGLFWWLCLSPITVPVEPDLSPETRRLYRRVGWLGVVSSVLFATGGIADGIQHSITGLKLDFADFLTWPHMIIYGSFLINVLISGVVLGRIVMGKGDPRIRARRVMPLTIFALASGYLISSLPVDAVWHSIYGGDIEAWSFPHVLIMVMSFVVSLTTAKLLLTSDAPGTRSRGTNIGVIILVACGTSVAMLMFSAVYEWLGTPVNAKMAGWVYPFIIFTIGLFGSLIVTNLTGWAGTATLNVVLTLIARLITGVAMSIVNPKVPMFLISYVYLLIPALALDLYYWRQAKSWQYSRTHALRASLIYTVCYWPVAYFMLRVLNMSLQDALSGAITSLIVQFVFELDVPSLAKFLASSKPVTSEPVVLYADAATPLTKSA
jgi:hypothetical protein